jgi:hypothetical protein
MRESRGYDRPDAAVGVHAGAASLYSCRVAFYGKCGWAGWVVMRARLITVVNRSRSNHPQLAGFYANIVAGFVADVDSRLVPW